MNNKGTTTITTQRLMLRRFNTSDTVSVFENWLSDSNVQNMYGEPAYETIEAADELNNRYAELYHKDDTYRRAVI